MPRSANAAIQNNFVGGLKTEFTGLNFPENAVTDTDNCVYFRTGKVARRKGIDIESNGVYNTLDRSNSAVATYTWLNAAGNGTINLLVEQVLNKLRFYKYSDPSAAPSAQLLSSSIDLTSFIASGFGGTISIDECQFSQGNGYLFVFHPHLDPFYVSYDPSSDAVVGVRITIKIRDFEGILGEDINQRPTTLTTAHRYNLGNQGWTSSFTLTSSTSVLIGTGSKTFTTNLNANQTSITPGYRLFIWSLANVNNFMIGTVTSFSGTSLVVNVTAIGGAGTFTDWQIEQDPSNILKWNGLFGNYPSNADTWWLYKNASNVFDPATTLTQVPLTGAANKGHYILDAFNKDRNIAASVTGLPVVTTGGERPSTGAFYQGRVFYAGINASVEQNKIYFSQTIQNEDQFGRCYQSNDPTSEDFFDLLPNDGGVIVIQGCGAIKKLVASKNFLHVFASNGIWTISGSQVGGYGFTANDYTIQAVANTKVLSHTSFVEVKESIIFWNVDGIWAVTPGQDGPQLESLSQTTIASFFDNIPSISKAQARGAYNPSTYLLQWVYRSTEPQGVNQKYEFDRVLNFNTVTGAFYPWSITDSTIKVNGIISIAAPGGAVNTLDVFRGGDNVVDQFGNQVIVFQLDQTVSNVTKFVISKPSGLTFQFSFAEELDPTYRDWKSTGVGGGTGADYNSFFTSAYALHSEAQRQFEVDALYIFCDEAADELCKYTVQGIWDWAVSKNTGKFTSKQIGFSTGGDIAVSKKKFRIRGHGLSLQLKFESLQELPFHIIGWSIYETQNRMP